MAVLNFFLELLQTPAVILAVVALIGLLALGYLVLSAGSSLLVTEILPFVGLFQEVFHLSGFATGSEIIVGAIQKSVPVIASTSAIIMGVGFLVNIVLARVTPLKYIFLTGHMMWISSVAVAFSLTTLGTVSSAYVGKLVGRNSKSAEDMKLPEGLKFFKDTSMSIAIVMFIFYMIVVIMAGPEAVGAYSGGTNYIIFGLLKALGFTAGVLVLLQGVRMLLGELVPAFKGISDKLVPNAVPALDVPALFGFAPNSLMLGFIFATLGMIVAMFISSALFGAVPLVSIIGAFFTGGVAGIMGNALGGRIGAMVSGFVYGVELILFSGFTYMLFGRFAAVGAEGTGHDCIDAMALMTLMKSPVVGILIIVAAFVLLSVLEVRYQKKIAVGAQAK